MQKLHMIIPAEEMVLRFLAATGISSYYREALLASFSFIQEELEDFLSLPGRPLKDLPPGIAGILKSQHEIMLAQATEDIFKRSSPDAPSEGEREEDSGVLMSEGSLEPFLESIRRLPAQARLPYYRYAALISKRGKNPDADP